MKRLKNPHNGYIVDVPQGFSFTTLFFSFLVPLFRGDFLGSILMIGASLITGGISLFIFPFFYNRMYEENLLKQGYLPVN